MQENIHPVHDATFYPQFAIYPGCTSRRQPESTLHHAERRKTRRYRVRGHLLSVCDNYAGQIQDISQTGLSFTIVHFLTQAGDNLSQLKPQPSDKLDILTPGLVGYFFRNVAVQTVSDLNLGRLYPKNQDIIVYRRSVRLATPLDDAQLTRLQRFLMDDQN